MKRWLIAMLMATCGAAVAQTPAYRPPPNAQPKSLKEVMIPPARRKPIARASQQSAVLSLLLDSRGGDTAPARLDRIRVVNSDAPKVFARSGGDWEVRLIGQQTTSYRIPNPLNDVEIENPPRSASPFSQVREPAPIRFELIVPLNRSGRSLGVSSIEIVDTVSGRTVIATPVRGGRPDRR